MERFRRKTGRMANNLRKFFNMERFRQNTERKENAAELWNNPEIITISFRRHSRYDRERGSKTLGALKSQGIKEAREAARIWHSKVPTKGAEISIYESPSFLEAHERQFPTPHKVRPMRAGITASLYEREAFGDLAPSIKVRSVGAGITDNLHKGEAFGDLAAPSIVDTGNELTSRMSSRRNRRSALGDFMDQAAKPELIPSFFKIVSGTYGQEMDKFWQDLEFGTLRPEVRKALADCGGSDNFDMAINMTTFLKESLQELKDRKNKDSKKEVAIAITHGETMGSFIAILDRYLESKGENPVKALHEKIKTGYNEGFDVHFMGNKFILEREGELLAQVDLGELENFLKEIRNKDVR